MLRRSSETARLIYHRLSRTLARIKACLASAPQPPLSTRVREDAKSKHWRTTSNSTEISKFVVTAVVTRSILEEESVNRILETKAASWDGKGPKTLPRS